jgi:multiple antibiotic resistance protein
MTLAITVFMGFFAIMNPISNTAVFVGMTDNMTDHDRKAVAVKSLLTAFGIVAVFCLLGKAIFDVFGITLPALRIAGGILVFMVGHQMLQGSTSKMQTPKNMDTLNADNANVEKEDVTDIAITPLAVPLLSGPGAIATAMNYSASGNIWHTVLTVVIFGFLCLITYVCFILGPRLLKFMGKGGITILTRLMGLILAVIAVQMIIAGVHDTLVLFGMIGH